jgi:hypothetical protein
VITGFNTDIDYEGITYHVQTEDKGLATPLILSLVYDRGTILASKRSPYDDLLVGEFDEKVLSERLKKQHKLICAAVRAGRIEDLKRMTMKESESRRNGLVTQKEVKSAVEKKEAVTQPSEIKTDDIPFPSILKEKFQSVELPVRKDSSSSESVCEVPLQIVEDPIVEAVEVVEEEMILPTEAVEILTDSANNEPAADDKLKIELIGESAFIGGEQVKISMIVRRGNADKGLRRAQILVKIIGSAFRPYIYHAKTDSSGVATVHLQLPHFRSGRAAILIKAMSEGEQTELRRIIQQG